MNAKDTALAYHHSAAIGASRVGQVVALYDTIVRDLHRAVQAVAAGDVEKRVAAVNHALLVISELQGVLDFERGGEPARNLENFYKVARGLILKGSLTCSQETFREAVSMITRVRAAWAKIDGTVPDPQPVERTQASMPKMRGAIGTGEMPELETPQSSRRWSG
ncbi:MAG TPA: flagellar export chaperone FliS [Candidatus Sulfotelmatobacter sp.]|nr:flagellar export chaperone FliS [Candidatus Sulfotelmatobacter sp.]